MSDKKRGRPKKETIKLSSNIILDCAKEIFLEENKIPSIRKIATKLNIDPMSIYYYFPNKNALLESITVSLMEEIYEPTKNNTWKKELELLCKSYLNLLANYPGLLKTMLSMDSKSPANVFIEKLQIILSTLNLDEKNFSTALSLLADYLHGVAFAMESNTDNQLTINEIDKPLKLYINAIENL